MEKFAGTLILTLKYFLKLCMYAQCLRKKLSINIKKNCFLEIVQKRLNTYSKLKRN